MKFLILIQLMVFSVAGYSAVQYVDSPIDEFTSYKIQIENKIATEFYKKELQSFDVNIPKNIEKSIRLYLENDGYITKYENNKLTIVISESAYNQIKVNNMHSNDFFNFLLFLMILLLIIIAKVIYDAYKPKKNILM
jgi:hypothetical protein